MHLPDPTRTSSPGYNTTVGSEQTLTRRLDSGHTPSRHTGSGPLDPPKLRLLGPEKDSTPRSRLRTQAYSNKDDGVVDSDQSPDLTVVTSRHEPQMCRSSGCVLDAVDLIGRVVLEVDEAEAAADPIQPKSGPIGPPAQHSVDVIGDQPATRDYE